MIAVTYEKIDEIVYGLYGITEEEREIIEEDPLHIGDLEKNLIE